MTMKVLRKPTTMALMLTFLAWFGCAGKINTTKFTNPQFDFGFVDKIAVLPLENLSSDNQAGERATRILITELLASGAVDVVEPGEVRAALGRVPGSHTTPNSEQVTQLGELLGIQAVISGSVAQSETIRSGNVTIPVVTLDLHMMETETGAPVWAATQTERGSGAGTVILGTGTEPISQTTRRCVRRAIRTLIR
jgi:TolB-like protein